jgi:restriction system protein
MRQQFSRTVEAQDLGKSQVLTGTDPFVLEKQGEALGDTWQAEAALEQVKNILHAALALEHKVNWEKLKLKQQEFTCPEPRPEEAKYQPVLTFFDRLIKSRGERKNQEARALYISDHAAWEKAKQESEIAIEARNAGNAAIDKQKADYESLLPTAITGYCNAVLLTSKYPDSFPKEFDLEYIPRTKILAIDYSLPSPDKMPNVKEVKYVKSKNEFHKAQLSETERNRIFDDALYQICLRTLHELFDADSVDALDAIVFNGWVESIDKATGKETKGCVISVQAKKQEFQEINLQHVDAKACFKKLKGVGSSVLHSLTAVAPILQLNREDKRFIPSREVENQIDSGFNLAAMDWEDFEQLVREIFEKEFSTPGGEVKVTQASRDRGVDAVAFDPDPIHGGKIVIQAKRYTNSVGVSFVRELWGTKVR